jgi:hypothetical protein
MSMNAKRINFSYHNIKRGPALVRLVLTSLLNERLREGVNVSLPDKSVLVEGTMYLQNVHDARPHKRLQYVSAGLSCNMP